MKDRIKEKYFAIRQMIRHLIKIYSEEYIMYVWFHKQTREIVYIDKKLHNLVDKENTEIYTTTLKNLYLYLFTCDYNNVDNALLVYFANKDLKRYSSFDVQILLEVTYNQLFKFENGLTEFRGCFSFDNLSKKLGFSKSEFNQTFKDRFKKVILWKEYNTR